MIVRVFAAVLLLLVPLAGQDYWLPTPPVAPAVNTPPAVKPANARNASTPWFDTSNRAEVAQKYNTIWTSIPSATRQWTGNVPGCVPGTTSQAWKNSIISGLNFLRHLAGIAGTVTLDDTHSAKDQAGALLFSANNQISHFPPSTWKCYSGDGAQAASNSNICISSQQLRFGCLDLYMGDADSNNSAVGHRRWILYPQTQSFGTGDTPRSGDAWSSNAIWVFDGNYGGPRPGTRESFISWPPPGYFPYQLVPVRWSFSHPTANLDGASVTMTRNGASVPVSLEAVQNGFGDNTIVWYDSTLNPSSEPIPHRPASDVVYSITIHNAVIGGTARTFQYTVTVFDPATVSSGLEGGVFRSGLWAIDSNHNWQWDASDQYTPLGRTGDQPVYGDFDGDGTSEMGIFRDGHWSIDLNHNGEWDGGDRLLWLGQPGDIPVTGDFNGSGITQMGVFRRGFWAIDVNRNGVWDSGDQYAWLGQNGDIPVVGDFNGDGIDERGVFRRGFWAIDINRDGIWEAADKYLWLGQTGDLPVVGDVNGDGRDETGIFRNGLWAIDANDDGIWEASDSYHWLGQAGDIPISRSF